MRHTTISPRAAAARRRAGRRAGLTVIELVVILLIVAVLAAIVIPRLPSAKRRAPGAAARAPAPGHIFSAACHTTPPSTSASSRAGATG